MLKISELSFSYNGEKVLNNITFTAEKGECVAVLGTNGAGKTTLLKCIDGILTPESGSVFADGKNIHSLKPNERVKLVGYVPQSLFFADTTVFDAVLTGRTPYIKGSVTKNDLEITANLLEQLGLSDISFREVNTLSGGEKQKTAIARALAQQPTVLLFDEPTSNLDIKNQSEVTGLIKKIAEEQGITVIVTMHDINLALRFADRFVMMKDNTVFSSGKIDGITTEAIEAVYGITPIIIKAGEHTVIVPAERKRS